MGLSRNKVAVPEGAAGSPPFYGVFQDAGLASVVWPACRGSSPVWRGRAGVEEIVGFAGPWGPAGSGADVLLGSRTATRDVWSRAVFRMPLAGRRRPCGPRVGSGRGAWWFENWIVDASNAMIVFIVCFIAISPGFFFGVWFRDRSFCDHFLQCDDLSSGV